jgi:hypothetical protein
LAHDDDALRRLRVSLSSDLILSVHRRVEPAGARLEREAEGVPKPAGDDAEVAPVRSQREHCRAPAVPLAAHVARRAAPEIEPPFGADDDVVLLVPAERQAP